MEEKGKKESYFKPEVTEQRRIELEMAFVFLGANVEKETVRYFL